MKNTLLTLLLLSFTFVLSAQDYLNEGDIVTEFSFSTINGDSISIEELKGKLVYINFFATWCSPCMKELAVMEEEILSEIDSEDFYFIALGRGHTDKQLKTFRATKGFKFNIGNDTDKSLFLRFSEKGIPLNIIINQEGEIIYKKTGFSDRSLKKIKKTIKRNL